MEVGVRHHVLISIVGIDGLRFPCYTVKEAQKRAVLDGPVAAGVLRSTQFDQLFARVFATCARFSVLPAGRIPLQPVDAREVALTLVNDLEEGPLGRAAGDRRAAGRAAAEAGAQLARRHRCAPAARPAAGLRCDWAGAASRCLDRARGAPGDAHVCSLARRNRNGWRSAMSASEKRTLSVVAFTLDHGRIRAIDVIRNPEKLRPLSR